MNRQIKFRAWIKQDKKMVDVYQLNFDGFNGFEVSNKDYEALDHLEIKLMQYTGLNDKRGREIYEGDIIRTHSGKNMVIGWSKKQASFVIERDGWMFKHYFHEALESEDCMVIGNIYEHPQLVQNELFE